MTCPMWYYDRCFGQLCRKLWLSRSCSPSKVVDTPFLSFRRGRSSWSRLFSRPLSFHSCCTFQVVDAPVVLVVCWFRCASAVFLLVVAGQDLRHLGWYDPKDSYCGMYKAGYAGCDAPCAVFVFLVLRPMVLGIMAGMVQKDSCSGMCKAGFTGYAAPRAVFFVVVRPRCSASWPVWNRLTVTQWAGFLVTMHLALCSLVCTPLMLAIMAVMDQKDSHVMVPLVRLQKTVESPQLQSIVGRRHLFRGAEAVSHGPDSSSDHRFSPVAVQGGRRPCLQVV